MKKDIVIGIIGGTGVMGQWFRKFFEDKGYKVLIAGRKTELTPIECAKTCDVVIISVPIDKTVEIIKQIGPHVREDALLTDFTSLKSEPVKAMLDHSRSEVIGCHPVFGPTIKSINKQTIVLCPARGTRWLSWFKDVFEKDGAFVKIAEPEEHDKTMAIVQSLRHYTELAFANTIKDLRVDVKETLDYTGPVYWLRMITMGRLLAQDPRLYADIEVMNPETIKVIDAYIRSLKLLRDIVEKKDVDAFVKMFEANSEYFKDFKNRFMEESDYLIEQMVKNK